MACQYLAFDIETSKDVPGEEFNWRAHRPLGISCAATLTSDTDQPRLWYGKTPDGLPDKRMSREDAQGLVQYLSSMAASGFRILSWNGLGFDFDVLAEESGAAASCRDCALGHVDMMFHVVCAKGYPVGLENAAKGLGLPGKPPGMSGALAPKLWAEGHFKEVLEYVAQDVRIMPIRLTPKTTIGSVMPYDLAFGLSYDAAGNAADVPIGRRGGSVPAGCPVA